MDNILEIVLTILKALAICFVKIIVAFFPKGVLPRKSVKGKVVLITGGGSGIGQKMAVQFAKLGARIAIWDINEKGNEETKKLVEEQNGEVITEVVDLTQRSQIYEKAEKLRKEFGDVHMLINNAGYVSGKLFMDISDELIDRTFSVNAISHFFTTKAFLQPMLDKNEGHIVTIASVAGTIGIARMTDYCASKYASLGFHDSLTSELRCLKKTGVKTTVVCPYFIDTGMFDGFQDVNFPFMGLLEPDYVVDCIMDAVLTDQVMLAMPKPSYLFGILNRLLPSEVNLLLADITKANDVMSKFQGSHISK